MPRLLSALLLAATASAELTTTLRLPFGGGSSDETYFASVVGVNGDTTTMLMEYKDPEMTDGNYKETITLHGTTSMEASMNGIGQIKDATYTIGCDMKDKSIASCVFSQWGDGLVSEYCGTVTMGKDATPTTTDNFGNGDDLSFCTPGVSELPKSLSHREQTMEMGDVKFIVTAGEEKLSATAGAKPTNSAAPSTTGSGFKTSAAPTGSPNGSPTGSAKPSGTGAGAAAPTGAASRMGAVGPVMVLGMAAAALLL